MTAIDYVEPQVRAGDEVRPAPPEPSMTQGAPDAVLAAHVPAVLALAVQTLFFLAYWLPETNALPGRAWWLAALAPLSVPALTSNGHPQVAEQNGSWGLPGLVWLVVSLAVPALIARRPSSGRWTIAVLGAAGTAAAGMAVLIAVSEHGLGPQGPAALVWAIWTAALTYAAWHAHLGVPATVSRPRRRSSGLGWVAAYAVLVPLPLAVGRLLVGHDLRDVAEKLSGNTIALRSAALWNGAGWGVWTCGVLAGVLVWVAGRWWPPRADLAYAGWSAGLVVVLIGSLGLGWPAASAAQREVTRLTYASPVRHLHFTCGSWVFATTRPGEQPQPQLTATVTGVGCGRLTLFRGYRQVATTKLAGSLAVRGARTPEGRAVTRQPVGARYDGMLVIAASDRFDGSPDQLLGVRADDGEPVWAYGCGESEPMEVRFALASGGDQPDVGRLTLEEVEPEVVVACGGELLRLEPSNGLRRS